MTACRPVPLKTLGCDSDGDGEGSFFRHFKRIAWFLSYGSANSSSNDEDNYVVSPATCDGHDGCGGGGGGSGDDDDDDSVCAGASDNRARHLEQQ